MKKIVVIAIVVVMAVSCSSPLIHLTLDRQQEMYYLDYSKYAAEGFMILPYPYQGEFDALGELRLEVNPKVIVEGVGWRRGSYEPVSSYFEKTLYYKADTTLGGFTPRVVIPADPELLNDLVRMAVDEAKYRGADAIANFNIEFFPDNIGADEREGYVVSGFLIKRK